MKKLDLQIFGSERSALIRNMIADYLEVSGKTFASQLRETPHAMTP